jgi:hypothetical protein
VAISSSRSEIDVNLNVSDVNTIMAVNIAYGEVGRSGPVLFSLTNKTFTGTLSKRLTSADFTAQPNEGIKTFEDAIDAMIKGNTYINVHTKTNPDGEIRGQIGPVLLRAILSGGQEVPPVSVDASGSMQLEINGTQDEMKLTLNVSNLFGITAAVIQLGGVGVKGGEVIFTPAPQSFTNPLVKTLKSADLLPAEGIKTFADAVDALIGGKAYINVNTSGNPTGAIRGQIGPVVLDANLSGEKVVPPVTTTAAGTITVSIAGSQDKATAVINYNELNDLTGASINVGAVEANGPAIFVLANWAFSSPFSKELITTNLQTQSAQGINSFADAINALLSKNTYLVIKTAAQPEGEIRGQIGVPDPEPEGGEEGE